MTHTDSQAGLLVVVSGLPGVGKSTISRMVSEEIDAVQLRTDEIRKELFDEPRYTPEEIQATYEEMFSRAVDELGDGNDVVLDATFSDRSNRETITERAASVGSEVVFVKVEADDETIQKRLANREDDESDADYRVYQEKKESFDEWSEEPAVVDNSGQLPETRRAVEEVLERHPKVDTGHQDW